MNGEYVKISKEVLVTYSPGIRLKRLSKSTKISVIIIGFPPEVRSREILHRDRYSFIAFSRDFRPLFDIDPWTFRIQDHGSVLICDSRCGNSGWHGNAEVCWNAAAC
jgi:hypothetical protein